MTVITGEQPQEPENRSRFAIIGETVVATAALTADEMDSLTLVELDQAIREPSVGMHSVDPAEDILNFEKRLAAGEKVTAVLAGQLVRITPLDILTMKRKK
ncbi:MAG: hypothetical protein WDN27_00265 [Candidatus Saccharibacteria bacterium]